MIVCVAIVSTVKKKTSSLVPPYESSVNVFDDNIIRRLAVLISEFHAATVTLLHPNWQQKGKELQGSAAVVKCLALRDIAVTGVNECREGP